MARVIMGVAAGCRERHAQQVVDAADGAAHISSGDLRRAEVARGSEVDSRSPPTPRGDLVPDERILASLVPRWWPRPATAVVTCRTGSRAQCARRCALRHLVPPLTQAERRQSPSHAAEVLPRAPRELLTQPLPPR